ncbi:transposase, MuDR, MULE transposase domain protein [Artemisia annua]|uniref:Transposase, MuDR, MULE transposase domain protein n=1 Tax=Artemisia annua TaxID=35608 RepID=A0A2U1LS91_ARTAN|nr:transposase, MuDR, MULE transposase domain protein [Artemisia annua]
MFIKIHCGTYKGSTMFVTKKIDENHTCPKTITRKHHKNANKSLIGYLVKEQLEDPNREYKPKYIIKDMDVCFGVNISYQQAYRGLHKGLEILRGSPVESFEKLPYYCHNLEKKNPGTVTKIKVDKEGRFEILFIFIGIALQKMATLRIALQSQKWFKKSTYIATYEESINPVGDIEA